MGLLTKESFPMGTYSPTKSVNFGTNRFALQLGAPKTWNVGRGLAPGKVTTNEVDFKGQPAVTALCAEVCKAIGAA